MHGFSQARGGHPGDGCLPPPLGARLIKIQFLRVARSRDRGRQIEGARLSAIMRESNQSNLSVGICKILLAGFMGLRGAE
jgi:hypothetical protein